MISVENLTKQYGATAVVDGVSMVIERNSITVIVGTSGSGKSTLLRMINRLVEPTRGRVLIDGNDTTGEPAHLLRRRIGYVIQGHGLFPHRTVAENIATVPRLLGWDAARIRARVEELLCVFQLDPQVYAAAFPHQLSGRRTSQPCRVFCAGMRLASAPASRSCCGCSSSIRRSTPQHSRISSRVVSNSVSVWRGRSPLSPPYC